MLYASAMASPGFPVHYQDLEYWARNSEKQAAVAFLAFNTRYAGTPRRFCCYCFFYITVKLKPLNDTFYHTPVPRTNLHTCNPAAGAAGQGLSLGQLREWCGTSRRRGMPATWPVVVVRCSGLRFSPGHARVSSPFLETRKEKPTSNA